MKSDVYQADWLDQISSGTDLRRRHNTHMTDSIVTRAQHLAGQDRDLVISMYRDGYSAAQIARLGNLDPRQVRRRIKLALNRMTTPLFIFVITHKSNWSPTRRKIAKSLFQSGNSIRQTATQLNLKVHQVRRHRTAILELMASASTPQSSPNRNWKSVK